MMKIQGTIIDMFYRAATGSRFIRILLTPVGLTLFFGFLFLFIVLSLKIDSFLHLPHIPPAPYNVVISVPVLTGGIMLILWSLLHCLRARGTPVPFNPPKRVITDGPYAFTRNPMVTGCFFVFVGLGIFFRSLFLTFVSTPIIGVFIILELKLVEEPELERRLGRDYCDYRKRVPMFIPRLKK
ncbi:isoprenylcysteine carboxylmethyltransferase family protein [bacterium]|nr:isoprenylcysteine carboxylmethyltransferase family protein [bacterium]